MRHRLYREKAIELDEHVGLEGLSFLFFFFFEMGEIIVCFSVMRIIQ